MLNLLVVYDDDDSSRGEYFASSHKYLYNKLSDVEFSSFFALNTSNCLEYSIDNYTGSFDGHSFIFIAYVHGNEDSLFISDSKYIHSDNAYLFNNTLFYACSCLAAQKLGHCLLENGCKVFLGFDATISSCNPEAEGIYQECENTFLEHFLKTDSTLQQCLKIMYEKYREREIYLIQNFSGVEAGILSSNLDAFKILYEDEVVLMYTKNDLFNS